MVTDKKDTCRLSQRSSQSRKLSITDKLEPYESDESPGESSSIVVDPLHAKSFKATMGNTEKIEIVQNV